MLKKIAVIATSLVVATSVTSCSSANSGEPITVGEYTTISSLDPAAVYGTGNFEVLYQIYPTLLNSRPGSTQLEPDIAEKAEFTSPSVYSVTLKSGLKFSNGHDLTASDAAFSLNRQIAIADEFGPSVLLENFEKAEAISELQVDFYLKSENDQTFPFVLSSVPGLIVDEETFQADRVLTNEEVISANAYAGPYVIDGFKLNEFISYKPNPSYKGLWGAPKNSGILVKYYADAKNLAFDAQNGNLDVAVTYRTLAGEEINSIVSNNDMKLATGDAAEPGYIIFNLNSMPYGATSKNPNAKKALAVRQAVAALIDREAISEQIYAGTYLPSYSPIPSAISGSDDSPMNQYQSADQESRIAKAKDFLNAAGINGKTKFDFLIPIDRYGPSTEAAMAMLKSQIEVSGLFEVNMTSAEWSAFRELRRTDDVQSYLMFWGPDFGDADNYISPLFATDGFLFNHYSNEYVDSAIAAQRSEVDKAKRLEIFAGIQMQLANDLPVIPFLETGRSAITKKNISGVAETIDASHKFKYFNFSRD